MLVLRVDAAPEVTRLTVRVRPFATLAFTVASGKIVETTAFADADRVRKVAACVVHCD